MKTIPCSGGILLWLYSVGEGQVLLQVLNLHARRYEDVILSGIIIWRKAQLQIEGGQITHGHLLIYCETKTLIMI